MNGEDVFRNQYATVCNILDGSDETLASFCAGLYQRKIIDDTVRNSVSRKPGIEGAGVLVNHIELMVKKKPDCLETVLEVMENEHYLKSVAKDMKREMGTGVDLSSSADESECVASDVEDTTKAFVTIKSPSDVFRDHFGDVCDSIPESTCTKLGNDLVSAQLLSDQILDNIVTNSSLNRYERVNKYMTVVRKTLVVNNDPNIIISLSSVLKKQKVAVLDKIADTMLTEIGCFSEKRIERKRKKEHEDTSSHSVKREYVQSSESDGEIKQAGCSVEGRIERKRKKKHEGSVKRECVQTSGSDGENKQLSKCELKTSLSSELETNASTINVQNVIEALGTHPDWFPLGIQLGLSHAKLKVIERNNPRDCVQCLHDMIADWIERGATWEKLVKALRCVNYIAKADEIEREYINEH